MIGLKENKMRFVGAIVGLILFTLTPLSNAEKWGSGWFACCAGIQPG